jgi:diguanylate cyclase (GGDEF)-like protein/PAS domain S-box-containing protein
MKTLKDELQLLILEDSPADAELMERELRQCGLLFEAERVDTEKTFTRALLRPKIDIILADYRLPEFDGITALRIARAKRPDIPFIFVSGTIGEDVAIEALKSGAIDYVLKDNLKRLCPSIRRALREKAEADERKRSERALKESEMRFRTLVREVKDYAIFRLDKNGNIVTWNEGVEHILGYKEREIIGKHLSILYPKDGDRIKNSEKDMQTAVIRGGTHAEETEQRKDGSIFFATKAITALRDEGGQIDGFSVVLHDISERKVAEETIRHNAFHDALTGLTNRNSMEEAFLTASESARRQHRKMALMFLDLDRFKTINDTLGHQMGDAILKEMAVRLKRAMRGEDIVSRWGGDEFVILAGEISSEAALAAITSKLLETIKEPVHVGHHVLHITTSVGIAMFPDDGKEITELLKNADVALYRAKHEGRDRYRMYDPDMNARFHEKLRMEDHLRRAITLGELVPFYQPIIGTDGAIAGVESLVRWNNPKFGFLGPDQFIPLAEESGLIIPIGEWMMREASMQYVKWLTAGIAPPNISVNVSSRQFSDQSFIDHVHEVLKTSGLPPERLELEITETIAMEDTPGEREKLRELHEIGVGLSIDDFGMGYSSLDYLKRYPVTRIKIDKSFVDNALSNKADSAIVHAVIAIAHGLGMRVVAEGVETKDQLMFLRALDCDSFQGYYFSKPLPASEFSAWLSQYQNNFVPQGT